MLHNFPYAFCTAVPDCPQVFAGGNRRGDIPDGMIICPFQTVIRPLAQIENLDGSRIHARDIKYYFEESGERKSGRFKDVMSSGFDNIKVTGTKIERRDCIGLIGKAAPFQYHLLALARRNDWEHCSKVVLISDGAKWIKGIKNAVLNGKHVIQILDLYHAKENA